MSKPTITVVADVTVYDGEGILTHHRGFDAAWQAHKERPLPVTLHFEGWVRKDA